MTQNQKPEQEQEDEFVMHVATGKRVKVGDLTEAEAKDIVRMVVREQRLAAELMQAMFGGIGLKAMFNPGEDEIPLASFHPGSDKVQ